MAVKKGRTAEGWERRRIRGQARRLEKKGFKAWQLQPDFLKLLSLEELQALTTEEINRLSTFEDITYSEFQRYSTRKQKKQFYKEKKLSPELKEISEDRKWERHRRLDDVLDKEQKEKEDKKKKAREKKRKAKEEAKERVDIGEVVLDRIKAIIEANYKGRFSAQLQLELDKALESDIKIKTKSGVTLTGKQAVEYNLSEMPDSIIENLEKSLKYKTKGDAAQQALTDFISYLRFGELLSEEEQAQMAEMLDDEEAEEYMDW